MSRYGQAWGTDGAVDLVADPFVAVELQPDLSAAFVGQPEQPGIADAK